VIGEKNMYNMKDVCDKTNLNYETLRYYCNLGLVPNVKRDKNNYRLFDDRDVAWINGLQCLRKCGLSIKELQEYMELAKEGESSVNRRKDMLNIKLMELLDKKKEIDQSIAYINDKNTYYDQILSGEIQYSSNIILIE
jgi:MerR family transcriptional regulator, aldehyde-responsive regulator